MHFELSFSKTYIFVLIEIIYLVLQLGVKIYFFFMSNFRSIESISLNYVYKHLCGYNFRFSLSLRA